MIPQAQHPLLSSSTTITPLNSTLCNTSISQFPHLSSFYSLGDSYSAGIGANCSWITDDFDPTGSCLKCKGAYPYQIVEIANTSSPSSSSPSPSSLSCPTTETEMQVYHLGCTGASMSDILTVGWDNRTSQLELMTQASERGEVGGWGTLSIGGNDVGFGNIVADCLMINTASCDASLNATETLLRDPGLIERLVETYLEVLDTAPAEDFTLLVLGYARFFNEMTEDCDKHFFIRGRYLTREFRRRLNNMIKDLNLFIQVAVAVVQMQLVFGGSRKSVFYEDWDGIFEGHRFCEGSPMHWERDAWFFTVAGDDTLDEGKTVRTEEMDIPAGEVTVDFEKLVRECQDERVGERDWTGRLLCNWAKALEEERMVRGKWDDDGFETMSKTAYPWYVKKTMHPKSIAHLELGKRIYERWMSGDYF